LYVGYSDRSLFLCLGEIMGKFDVCIFRSGCTAVIQSFISIVQIVVLATCYGWVSQPEAWLLFSSSRDMTVVFVQPWSETAVLFKLLEFGVSEKY
jgi:hypothetical protein